jgi:hypothetical protein
MIGSLDMGGSPAGAGPVVVPPSTGIGSLVATSPETMLVHFHSKGQSASALQVVALGRQLPG